MSNSSSVVSSSQRVAATTLLGVSMAHLLNDLMQNAVPAAFPMFQQAMQLSFTQIGWIAFTLNLTASILQPLIGAYTDRKPMPFMLPLGMIFTLLGMAGLALSPNLAALILSAACIGIGSSVLHPESSRVAHLAAGKGRGMAQSIFQVGGNTGQALAPLLVAYVVTPRGPHAFLWFMLFAAIGIVIQAYMARWYKARLRLMQETQRKTAAPSERSNLSRGFVLFVIGVLLTLLFSKFVYLAGMTGYYAFYFMDHYGLSLERAQTVLFALQFAGMAGTLLGGPLADRIGRKQVIWFSILGTAPFSLLLPYASPGVALILCLAIGAILMSGFSVIIVYAQEMLPGRVGTIAGLFFGLSFGLAGLGSVALGWLTDQTDVAFTIRLCSYLPLLGIFAFLLPRDKKLMNG
ncbi:MFS transporter [Paenibacillus sp. HB172176]|uniref:MFS transporter n=1 Tax=Paenibacillus sp. HB172176 TaxID=2493690 RepID=UPI00143920A4|nr:MFS transporter [Paenibacillus sp. HB172176]